MFLKQNVPLTIDGTKLQVNIDGLNTNLETDKYLIRLSSINDYEYMVSAFFKKEHRLQSVISDVHIKSITQLSTLISALNSYIQQNE